MKHKIFQDGSREDCPRCGSQLRKGVIECPCGWEDSPYIFVKEELSQAALEHGYKTKFAPQLKDLSQKLVSKKTCPGCKVALALIEMDGSFMAGCPKCGAHKTINLK